MRFIFTVFLFIIFNPAFSQQAEVVQSIGLRAGGGSGITYKYIEDFNYAIEGIISYRDNGVQLTGLWERYEAIKTDQINNLYFFWGLGAHAGYIREKEQFCVQTQDGCGMYQTNQTNVIGGFDGILGFEYQFYSIPMAISLDYNPYMEFFGQQFFSIDFWNFGVSFKYTF